MHGQQNIKIIVSNRACHDFNACYVKIREVVRTLKGDTHTCTQAHTHTHMHASTHT